MATVLLWRIHAARRWRADPAVAALLGVAGVLLRNEVVLLLASIVTVHAVRAARHRAWDRLAPAVSAGGRSDRLPGRTPAVERWVGGESAPATISAGLREGAEGSLSGLRTALLRADLTRPDALSALIVVLVGALGALAIVRLRTRPSDAASWRCSGWRRCCRRRPPHRARRRRRHPLGLAGAVAATGLGRDDLRGDVVGPGPAIAAVFAVAVLLT